MLPASELRRVSHAARILPNRNPSAVREKIANYRSDNREGGAGGGSGETPSSSSE